MDFKQVLTDAGLNEEQVDTVNKAMAEAKIYTTEEPDAGTRIQKAIAQRDSAREELNAANKLVDDYKKSTTDNEETQAKISAYETQVSELQTKLTNVEKTNVLKVELGKAGVTDVDYAIYKMGGVDGLELTDGKITNLESKVKDLKETIPTYFKTDDPVGDDDGNEGDPAKDGYKLLDGGLPKGKSDGDDKPSPFDNIMAKYATTE